jgi:molybdenum cofactor synthesis domain-containing protein
MQVALVTVGDELLAGETTNTNAVWLSRRLADSGATVERVTTVPDRVGDIARVVNEYQAEYDAVIVTGGLGPTHDDVTMEGVAAAFGTELAPDEEAREWLETETRYEAADLAPETTHIPKTAEMIRNPEGVAPGCIIGNTFVLPGVPVEMKGMFRLVADEFVGEQRYVRTVQAAQAESELLDTVESLRSNFDVTVGSYPGKTVTIRIKGLEKDTVETAASWVAQRVDSPE